MPTFDEMYADFGNCMDYLFSNPDGKTCMRCNDDVVLAATPSYLNSDYPYVNLYCKNKLVLTYSTDTGYELSKKDYNKIIGALA